MLTKFQNDCELALSRSLERLGLHLIDRRLEGEKETFVKARVEKTTVWIYIYEDEAGIDGQGTYEVAAFKSAVELQNAFVQGVVEKVRPYAI